MDNDGIYAGSVGYKILESDSNLPKILNGFILQSNETFTPSKHNAEFMQKYNKLEWLQINYRIFGNSDKSEK